MWSGHSCPLPLTFKPQEGIEKARTRERRFGKAAAGTTPEGHDLLKSCR
jgi:hypothetical protein